MPIVEDIYHIAVSGCLRTHPLVATLVQVIFDVAKQSLNIGGDLRAENHELGRFNVQENESARKMRQGNEISVVTNEYISPRISYSSVGV